jgi:hypothetical protein
LLLTRVFGSHFPFQIDRPLPIQNTTLVKSVAHPAALPLVVIPLLFFWAGAGVVAGAGLSGELRFVGFCLVFVPSGMSLTSEVHHLEFPPGISEGFMPGVAMQCAVTLMRALL